jgi:hypothetical protein
MDAATKLPAQLVSTGVDIWKEEDAPKNDAALGDHFCSVVQILGVVIHQNEMHEKEITQPARTERRKKVTCALA